jgi:hypothetical protein
MGENRRLRRSTLILAALLVLGALQALSGNAAGWDQSPGRSGAVVVTGNAAVVAAPAALDTRLLTEGRPDRAPRASGHDGLSAARSLGPSPGPSGRRAAATTERAAHPERRSGTRLRGPPPLPV